MKRNLIAIGASGQMKDVAFILQSTLVDWKLVGILDDAPESLGKEIAGAQVLGPIAHWSRFQDHWFVVAVGAPRLRAKIVGEMQQMPMPKFATLAHPSAQIADGVVLGHGAMIGPGASISVDARIGVHAIVNANATIAHDGEIGDFCTIAPQAALSGNVTIGDGVELGTAASLRQGLRIGTGAMVGMGSVVISNVDDNACVVGNPARLLKMLTPFSKSA